MVSGNFPAGGEHVSRIDGDSHARGTGARRDQGNPDRRRSRCGTGGARNNSPRRQLHLRLCGRQGPPRHPPRSHEHDQPARSQDHRVCGPGPRGHRSRPHLLRGLSAQFASHCHLARRQARLPHAALCHRAVNRSAHRRRTHARLRRILRQDNRVGRF